jgi:hypothetical protein
MVSEAIGCDLSTSFFDQTVENKSLGQDGVWRLKMAKCEALDCCTNGYHRSHKSHTRISSRNAVAKTLIDDLPVAPLRNKLL